jgi:hypothetical protein
MYYTKDSNHNVEDPLQPQTVGDNIISKANVLKPDEFFNNKMIDIQQKWLENELSKKRISNKD